MVSEDKEILKELLDSGNVPPKPALTFEEEYGDKKYSFEISEDFIPFNSHSEADPSFQYEPYSNDDFTAYDERLPIISIAPDDDIYDAIEEFESSGSTSVFEVTPCDHPCFLFSAFFEKFGNIFYAYAFAAGTARETEMISVQYSPEIKGTALEKKLIAILDNIVSTYSEEEF